MANSVLNNVQPRRLEHIKKLLTVSGIKDTIYISFGFLSGIFRTVTNIQAAMTYMHSKEQQKKLPCM